MWRRVFFSFFFSEMNWDWRKKKKGEAGGLVGEDRLRRGEEEGEAGGSVGLPFRALHNGRLPACVGSSVVTFDPEAGGLQWQRRH